MLTFPQEQCHTTQTHSSDSQLKELSFTVISFKLKLLTILRVHVCGDVAA